MIKNIVFDLGGVIITLGQDEAIRRFEALGLADAHERLDAYTQSGIFGDLERGDIDAETFRVELGRLVGHEVTYDQCRHAVNCPSVILTACAGCAVRDTGCCCSRTLIPT